MNKILFLVLHRKDRSPGQRFRHEQYLNYLEKNGFDITYSNMLSAKQDKVFYDPGDTFHKIGIGISTLLLRLWDVVRARNYDYIFIYRDAFFFGVFIEKMLRWSNARLVFDFDDSIWLHDENQNQSWFHKLKNPNKTAKIIRCCDIVIAGNEYLANYAGQFNKNVIIIPTTIDLSKYPISEKKEKSDKICIGWSGSFSTIKHFESALEPLKALKEKFGDRVYLRVIGDGAYRNQALDIQGKTWNRQNEVEDLCEMDIGIMPLPDDNWSKGKCGLKGLQYMALEIPTIMSPVGVNADIIRDGENGFLAANDKEWVNKITMLIENAELRKKIGAAGRKTVEEYYSVEANKDKWADVFRADS